MTALVVIAGALSLASGLIKLFGRGRLPGGIPLLAVLEVVAGLALPLFALANRPPLGVLSWGLGLTLILVAVSSGYQISRARAFRRHREETEAARLQVWVRYLSSRPENRQDLGRPGGRQ